MRWVVIVELLIVLVCALAFAVIHGRRRAPAASATERATWRQLMAMAVVVAIEAALLVIVGLGWWSDAMWWVLAGAYFAADVVMIRWLVLLMRARRAADGG